jgi:putative DNA methylase
VSISKDYLCWIALSKDKIGERRVLIDDWFPITEVSVESVRERSASSALPPLYFLHVWFARRPLTTSRAAILGSIVSHQAERKQFLRLLGIPPDKNLAEAAKLLEEAKSQKKKLANNPFSWERAFKHVPSDQELAWLKEQALSLWGGRVPTILDPMAGGGSIPYEAVRLGLPAIVSDLNPVSYVILKATVEYPAKFGERLIPAVKEFCLKVHESAKKELEEFFPKVQGEKVYAYLWSRTVRCEHCGTSIPLSPNWWIVRTDSEKIAVRPILSQDRKSCTFEVIENFKDQSFDPDEGTDVGKAAKCINCGKVNDGNYVKDEAKTQRMGHQLYVVCSKIPSTGRSMKWYFRIPRKEEVVAAWKAEQRLKERLERWNQLGLVPVESVSYGLKTRELLNFGMLSWSDLFNPRQLLVHLTYLERLSELKKGLFEGLKEDTPEYEFAEAVAVYSAIVFDTCVDYNCLLSLWHPGRSIIAHMMGLQGFPFKTSYAEWNQTVDGAGYEWATDKTIDALTELIKLLPAERQMPRIFSGDAANMKEIPDKSIECIVVDPPYAENVMYGEVMNFFYVWMKRTLGDIFPEVFKSELTDTSEEAVANSSLFKDAKSKSAKKLAEQHYQSKMEACFKEMNRVLRDDGRLIVMFTHRKAEAWAGLATSLVRAGFTFTASWPVLTEPGEKFGKKEKGVLKITVLLVCKKRLQEKRGLWEEVNRELYEEAEKKVKEHNLLGISGPDLMVSTYGPVLGRFADYSIVKDATGQTKGPEDALKIVAEVVNKFLTADIPSADFETLAYLNLLRNFPYLQAEYDLARIATVFGGNISLDSLDVKGGRGLVKKEGNKVTILSASQRVESGNIRINKPETLRTLIDVVHAALVIYERMGLQAVKSLLVETGRDSSDSGFLGVLRVIAQLGMNGRGAKSLIDEGRTANALSEALGHDPETTRRTGESLTHYM